MLSDLRYAYRQFVKYPGFTAIAILTLAVGIGATTTIFSAVNAVLLRPLPVADPARVVRIFADEPGTGLRRDFSFGDYRDYREENRTLQSLVGAQPFRAGISIDGVSELASGEFVTANFFDGLGIEPVLGRGFVTDEERAPNAAAVVVLGYDLWRRLTGGDSTVVGRVARLNNRPFTVVGVAPRGFGGTNFAVAREMWVPIMMRGTLEPAQMAGSWVDDRQALVIELLGVLLPTARRADAQADLNAITERLAVRYPRSHAGVSVRVVSERAGLINPEMPRLVTIAGLVMLAVVALVLIVVCANVAGLLLARAVAREQEVGVRLALGASRGRLVRLLLLESALLAVPAGVLGLLTAAWASPLYTAFLPSANTPTLDFSPDRSVALFAVSCSLAAVVLFGLAPALFATRASALTALASGGRSGVPRKRLRLLRAVAGVQLALSVIVLTVAGLLIRAALWQQAIDPGFDPSGRLAISFDVRVNDYEPAEGHRFYDELVARVSTLPGVRSASLTHASILGLTPETRLLSGERVRDSDTTGMRIAFNVVGDDYFRTVGTPLLRGRGFTSEDRVGGRSVVIVNQSLARRLGGEEAAVGQQLAIGETESPVEVIGVAADAKYTALAEAPQPFLYLPFGQHYRAAMSIIVWSGCEPASVVRSIRDQVRSIDGTMPVTRVVTLQEAVDTDLALARTASVLAVSIGVLVLFLATLGLFGVLSFSMRRRTREIGIRMALGARQRDILQLVLGQGLSLAALATAIGVGLAGLFVGQLSGLFFDISPRDPLTFGAVVLTLIAVSTFATYLPARRAARLQPMESLREE